MGASGAMKGKAPACLLARLQQRVHATLPLAAAAAVARAAKPTSPLPHLHFRTERVN